MDSCVQEGDDSLAFGVQELLQRDTIHRHGMPPKYPQRPSQVLNNPRPAAPKKAHVINNPAGFDASINFSMSKSFIRAQEIQEIRNQNEGSIRVDSFAFGESKVLATERKVIDFAEKDKE